MLIDYNMSKEYCADWTPIDAIREMVQNAIDSLSDYECKIDKGYIHVTTKNRMLPTSSLVLGNSVKSENAIGKYGEGYKIGMLVLTREGLVPTIQTHNKIIGGLFSDNQFNVETFKLQVEDSAITTNDIYFKCKIGDIDLEELEYKLPAFSSKPLETPATINILHDRAGDIYVNGLYVTHNKDLSLGYNFSPSHIKLNRDRNMVDGIHWQLAEYYANLGKEFAETIFNLVEREAEDVRDLSYHLHDTQLKAELAKLFYNRYGEGAKIAKPGVSYISNAVITGYTSARVYIACGIEEAEQTIDTEAPDQVLQAWAEANKSKLRRDVRNSLDKVITKAKGWRKAELF